MDIFEPVEAWTSEVRSMTAEQAAEMNGLEEAVRVQPDSPGRWRVETNSRIGVLVGSDWELRIRPRLSIPRLNFLLAYAWRRRGYRDLAAGFEQKDDVVGALASGFAYHAERALHFGVLHGYVHIDEQRQDLRGRVRFADQIARVPGRPLPLEVSYDDFAIDIEENRMLRTAAELLLRIPRIPEMARTRLLRVRALLEDVSLITRPRDVRAPVITRLNERYESALLLAELIFRSTSLDFEHGSTRSVSFVFDMNKVFEDFVTAALEGALRPYGGWVTGQHRDSLDVAGDLSIIPDIVWRDRQGIRAVVDAKYKSLLERHLPNGDAYQMLAYCTALNLPRGFLVYAKESGKRSRDHVVKFSGHVVAVRALDVELEPAALLAQVGGLASELANRAGLSIAA